MTRLWQGSAVVLALRLGVFGAACVNEVGVYSCGLCVEVSLCRWSILRSHYPLHFRGGHYVYIAVWFGCLRNNVLGK
jgi:hypothetical protein